MRLIVDPDAGTRTEMLAEGRGESADTVIEVRKHRAVQMVLGELGRHPVGDERVEMWRRITLDHNCHRPEQRRAVTVLSGRGSAGGIGHRTRPEQHQTVDTLRLELSL